MRFAIEIICAKHIRKSKFFEIANSSKRNSKNLSLKGTPAGTLLESKISSWKNSPFEKCALNQSIIN